MKKLVILFVAVLFAVNAFSQVRRTVNFESLLINKQWYIKYDAYERTGVGDKYEKDKRRNLLELKSNNNYTLKLDGIERSGTYLIENGLLFLFTDNDYELAYEKNKCVAFRLKMKSLDTFQLTSVAYASEGSVLTIAKY
jgi:hypothetical protein